jgi:hypothetical protein
VITAQLATMNSHRGTDAANVDAVMATRPATAVTISADGRNRGLNETS